ncbi:IGc2 [Cichlidogyrus casuarinus]|uniref:IGc2 n=1 Tax=Cichlidogyrus casuarinus TaxID=1844966 RepID=A0ABD2QGK0_9PLAT
MLLLGKPRFIDGNERVFREIVQGEDLVLNCTADGDPPPKIEWTKDGQIVRQGGALVQGQLGIGPEYVISPDGFSLHVYGVVHAVSGVFTCLASNPLGLDTKEFRVNVKSEIE